MFKNLIKGLLVGTVLEILGTYRRLLEQLFKIETAKCYLHGVRMARLSAIGLMLMGLILGLICLGVLLFHAGLFILLPWSLETKAVLGICLGTIYTVTGGLALRAAMSEKTWMDKSGAARMLEEATRQPRS